MSVELLKIWDEIDTTSFIIEEENEVYNKDYFDKLIDKLEKSLSEYADIENRKVYLDIKDRIIFIIAFFALLKLNAKVVLVPPEVNLEDYYYPGGFFISDNKNHNGIFTIDRNIKINADINFNAVKMDDPVDNNTLLYLYTSGSTGKPKLINKSSLNILTEVEELKKIFNIKKNDVFYFTPPIYHIYGFLNGFMLPVLSSSKIIIDDHFAPESIAKFVKDKNITNFISIPSYYKMFVELNLIDYFKDCSRLISSSAPLPYDVSEDFYSQGIKINEIYGSTETGGIAHRVSAVNRDWKMFSYVKINNQLNHYLNSIDEDLETELLITSPAISVDYNPEDGFNTGDIVNLKKDGNFTLLGRNTRFVKISGKRVDLHFVLIKIKEYLSLFSTNPVDEDSLYVGSLNNKIYLLYEGEYPKNSKDLKTDLNQYLPSYSVPKVFISSKIPKNNMGKIKKSFIEDMVKNKLESNN